MFEIIKTVLLFFVVMMILTYCLNRLKDKYKNGSKGIKVLIWILSILNIIFLLLFVYEAILLMQNIIGFIFSL